jgi:murein DD-endopeptidase MepM/ murein hydrolase activator NlpD
VSARKPGVAAVIAVPLVLLALLVTSALMASDHAARNGPAGCDLVMPGVSPAGKSTLSDTQLANAATIIGVGKALGVAPRGWVVALAAAKQEAGILNLASRANPGSLGFPHDGVADGDHDSVGIFQQRDAWGSLAARMNVATSARMFFTGGAAGQRGLLDVPGWQSMSTAEAAQAVQVSAFPSAYAQWESLAVATVNALAELDVAADCGTAGTGAWVPPVPDGYTITARFGDCGERWSDCHTGTDFAIPSGTPVHAAASGVVAFVGWGGAYGNLIQINHGDGTETWYAHLSAATVQLGTRVEAGTVIGTVGSTGNTTGPHLHFEVRVADRHVDSWRWLQQRVREQAQQQVAGGSPTYTIATFNMLGHSHTVSGGNKPGYAPSPMRTRWAIRLLNRHGVDVIGLQEFQAPQHRAFTAAARGSWRVFPGPGPHNAIAWRRAAFDLVATDTVAIPYFDGQRVRMPIVRLRHRASGQQLILINVHNPADTRSHPNQGRWRALAKRHEITLAHQLLRNQRLPVFVVGDMNEKQSYFCDITEPGALVSAAGGSNHGACAPPRPTLIDQIYGPASVRFHGYTVNHRTLGRISDHPLILTRVG